MASVMSNVYFIGDLHFGHSGIQNFRTQFPNEKVHDQYIVDCWNGLITKRDLVFVMGDAAFTQGGINQIGNLCGRKILIRGNHDIQPIDSYLKVFEEVWGAFAYKGLWLTHIPIHPSELYGRTNVHGHCHRGGPTEVVGSPMGGRGCELGAKATYFNTCAEHLPTPYTPIELHHMEELIRESIKRG
jgi:calcineurin-like phosphoesterase family protein